jgi:hypothetical protein
LGFVPKHFECVVYDECHEICVELVICRLVLVSGTEKFENIVYFMVLPSMYLRDVIRDYHNVHPSSRPNQYRIQNITLIVNGIIQKKSYVPNGLNSSIENFVEYRNKIVFVFRSNY